MILLTVIQIMAGIALPVHHLPPVCESADVLVVMMNGGLLPEEPWEGMSSYQREEFWTLACSGMMVQRAAWSGYIIICPLGTGAELVETARALASADGVPDNSAVAAGLELVPVSDCSSTVVLFSRGGTDPVPSLLPLRQSLWLGGGADTMMISSPDEGNAFFWTGHRPEGSLSPAAWRGTGSELVPTAEGPVELSFTCVHGSVPSNLLNIELEPHPLDLQYMDTWGSAFAAVDSMVASGQELLDDPGHLLWIRGSDYGRPWRTAPSPMPPPSASYSVPAPSAPAADHPLKDFSASNIPNAARVALPGRLTSLSIAPVIEAVLERMVGRDLHANTGGELFFDVESRPSGEVSIWLIGSDGRSPGDSCLALLDDILMNSILVPPGRTLIGNCLVRASYLAGRPVDSVGVREISMELMNILYPE